jgi:hypothetical protein
VVFIPEIDLGHMSFEERYDYADQQRERGERLQAESDQAWLDSLPPDLKELWVHMTPAMRMHELARNEDKDRMRFEQMSPAMQERQRQQDEEDLRRWERESRWKKMSPAEQERALWAQLTPAEQERARQLQPPRSTTEALVRQDVIYEVFKLRGGKPDWNGRTYSYPEAYQTRLDVLRPYLRDGIHRNLAEEEAFRFQQYWEDRAEDAARPDPAAPTPANTYESLCRLQALKDRWEHHPPFFNEDDSPRLIEDVKREYIAIAPFLYRGECFDEDESIAYWAERR